MGGKGVFGGKRDMYYNENNNTSLYIHPTLIFFSIVCVCVCMRCVCVLCGQRNGCHGYFHHRDDFTRTGSLIYLFLIFYRQQYIPYTPRGGDYRRGRGGYHQSQRDGNEGDNQQQQPQRVPPPTYVCYRCGQKGKHYRWMAQYSLLILY